MERILFYTNEWDDVTKFVELVPVMESSGMELAFATERRDLAELMAVGKLLVINPKVYNCDLTVYRTNRPKEFRGTLMSYDELVEVFDE